MLLIYVCIYVGGFNSWAREAYWTKSPITGIYSWIPEVSEIAYNYILPQNGKIVDLDGSFWFNFKIHHNILHGCQATLYGENIQYYQNIAVVSCNGLYSVEGAPDAHFENSGYWNNTIIQLVNDYMSYISPCSSSPCGSQSPLFYNNVYYYPSPGAAIIWSGQSPSIGNENVILTLDKLQNPVTASALGYHGLGLYQNETGSVNRTLPQSYPYFRPNIQSGLGVPSSISSYYTGELGYDPTKGIGGSQYIFNCIGTSQTWTATCSIADIWGFAAAGSAGFDTSQRTCPGGSGGVVHVRMSFTIGANYTILVGCTGFGGNPNAGGIPVIPYPAAGTGQIGGSHGGGRTAIRNPSDIEILSVGGGGGGGTYFPNKNYAYFGNCDQIGCIPYPRKECRGGSGGGLAGEDGEGNDLFGTDFSLLSGFGGTQIAGGYGGLGPTIWNQLNSGNVLNSGEQGGLYQGGSSSGNGAGGGDGYRGGGGSVHDPWSGGSGAGGGGSSYVNDAAVLTVYGNWRGDSLSIPFRPNSAGSSSVIAGVGAPGLLIITCEN